MFNDAILGLAGVALACLGQFGAFIVCLSYFQRLLLEFHQVQYSIAGGFVQSAGQDAREGNAVFLVAWIVEFSDWFW